MYLVKAAMSKPTTEANSQTFDLLVSVPRPATTAMLSYRTAYEVHAG
jgi:hypothetical protein